MSFLNELENNLRSRINRVNPDASINTRPSERRYDWLRNSLDSVARRTREAIEPRDMSALDNGRSDFLRGEDERAPAAWDFQRKQERDSERKRFVDEFSGKNVGSFDDAQLGRISLGSQVKKGGVLGAFADADPEAIKRVGQAYRNAYNENLGKYWDENISGSWEKRENVRRFVQSGLSAEGTEQEPEWIHRARSYFEQNKGRGQSWNEYKKTAKSDPDGFLASLIGGIVESPDIPPDVRDFAIGRWKEQPELSKSYRIGVKGPVGQLTEGVLRKVTPKSLFGDTIAALGGGLVSSAERPVWAGLSIPDALTGSHLNIDRWSGNDLRDRGAKSALGLGVDSGATWASFGIGGLSGKGAEALLGPIGRRLGASAAGRTGLAFLETLAVNAGIDLPSTVASMKLQGYSDAEIRKTIPMILAGDVVGAGGIKIAGQLGETPLKRTGAAGRFAGQAAGTGAFAYGAQRLFGVDNRDALENAAIFGIGGVAAMRGGGAAGRRMGLTENIPAGTKIYHGTRSDFPVDAARPTPGPGSSIGEGLYGFGRNQNEPDAHPGAAASDWVTENRQDRYNFGKPEGMTGANVAEFQTDRPLTALNMDKPLTMDEFGSLNRATGIEGPAIVSLEEWAKKGTLNGWDYQSAVRNMFRKEPAWREAGFATRVSDAAGARAYAFGDTSVLSDANKRNTRLQSVIQAFRKIEPGEPGRMGSAALPSPRSKVEANLDNSLERFRGEDGHLHMEAADIEALRRQAIGDKYPGTEVRLSLDDMRYAIEEGMPGAHWYDIFAPVIDALALGDKGGAKSRLKLSIFAVTSQQAPPNINLIKMFNSLRAINELTQGGTRYLDPEDLARMVGEGTANGIDGNQIKKIVDLYNEGLTATTTAGATKTPTYFNNLLDSLLHRYSAGVTVDTHHGSYFSFFKGEGNDISQASLNKGDPAYQFAQRMTQHLAAELGLQPKVVQAAMWETMKKVKEAANGDIAAAFDRGELTWKEAVELSRGHLATGGHLESFGDADVAAAHSAFLDSVKDYGDSPPAGAAELAYQPKTKIGAETAAVSGAQQASARADVAGRSPIIEFSTKSGQTGRVPAAQEIALQPSRLKAIGFSDDLTRQEDLDAVGIPFEVIEESRGAWTGIEPNVRIRIVGGNADTAEFAAAVIAKRLEAIGQPQDAVAIHSPGSPKVSSRGFELPSPDGKPWSDDELVKIEEATYASGKDIGLRLKTGDPTRLEFNQYYDFGDTDWDGAVTDAVTKAGHRPDLMTPRTGDSYLFERPSYDSTLEQLSPRFDPDGRLQHLRSQPDGGRDSGAPEGPLGGPDAGGGPRYGAGGAAQGTGPAPGLAELPGGHPSPVAQAATQAAAGGAFGAFNPEDDESWAEAALRGAGSAVLSPAINRLQRHGSVAGVRSAGDEKGIADALRKSQNQLSAERSARLKKAAAAKLDELTDRRTKAAASPEATKAFQQEADDFIAHAEATLGDVSSLKRTLKDIPGLGAVLKGVDSLADPASNFSSYYGRSILTGTLAAANYMRYAAGLQSGRTRELMRSLEPLMGGQPHLKNAAKQVGTFATPVIAGEVATQLTGQDEYREAGVLAGIGASAFVSGRQKMTKWQHGPWESVALKSPELAKELPDGIQTGAGKLYDILQNPDRYDLDPSQAEAILAYKALRETMVKQTNAALASAGMDEIITPREMHGILQWFEPSSMEAAGLGGPGRKAFDIRTPGFDRLRAVQMQRELGPSFEEALKAHPGLEPIRDPEALLALEVKMHDQIRANALLVKHLKDSGISMRIPGADELAKMDKAEAAQWRTMAAGRERAGWQKLPGIDDYVFHPDAVKAVTELLMPSRGRETGPIAMIDMVTNVVRQTMFTADASAWTMQGAMLAINDPIGTILNAKHLVGATVIGRRYFDDWVKKNPEIWRDFTKASGVGGFEHEGLEKEGLTLSKLPFVGHLERRGFESFLPIHRALMHKNLAIEESFIRRIYGKDLLGAKRLAANALKTGPAALGIGAALSDFDVPGVDDDWEKLFLVALGVGSSIAGRKAVSGMAGDVSTANRVTAAKQVNRTSGTLNRQAYGITAEQAQWERTLLARSPALMRNTLILAKKAATDFGPEGAMARFYLVKTAALVGTGLAAAQWASTGKMPSLDPNEQSSIFNPGNQNFMRADLGPAGRLTASNPLISLVKAFMRTDAPDGVKTWREKDWVPILGLADWYQARQSDIVGPLIGGGVGEAGRALQQKVGGGGESPGYNQPKFQLPIPLALRAAFETGVPQKTETGKLIKPVTDALGLKEDTAFTNTKEKVLGVAGTFAGMNASPETLSRELLRIKTAAVTKQYPGLTDRNKDGVVDYNDLNDEQQGKVRGQLDADPKYNKALGSMEKSQEGQPPDNIQRYFDAIAKANGDYEMTMQGIDFDYKNKTISAFNAKSQYQNASKIRRDAIKAAEDLYGILPAGRHGTDETVSQYLDRDLKSEDAAVQRYYDLYDAATGKDGKLNFNTLEKSQAQFLAGLSPDERAYVERRVASFDKPETTQFGRDYENAKSLTQPYWDATESAFAKVAGKGVFAGFTTYADFEDAINTYANEHGVSPQLVLASLSRDGYYKRFEKLLSRERMKLVRSNEGIGSALMNFYGKVPPAGTQSYREYLRGKRDRRYSLNAGELFSFDR